MLSAIGDAVHVLPVANALKRAVPGMKLTWVIQPVPHKLVHNHPAIDEFIIFRRRRGLTALGQFLSVRRELRRHQFDLVIDLQVYLKAGILTWFTPAPTKLGFDRVRARDLNWLFTTQRIPPHPVQHVQDQYFEFLHFLGVSPEPVIWGLRFTDEERQVQREFFAEVEKPVCSVVVGSSKPKKDWPPDGPAPRERATAAEVARLTRAQPLNELGDNLRKLAYLVDGSDVLVSPDTGPLHIARALETPVVGLYGYTNPKRTGPYRKYTDLVVDGYARYPGEEYEASMEYRPDGMNRITVGMVREKFELAVSKYTKARP